MSSPDVGKSLSVSAVATVLFRTPRHLLLPTLPFHPPLSTSQHLTLPPRCILHNRTAREPTSESYTHPARSPEVTSPVPRGAGHRRGPDLAPGATWPQRLRRRTPSANHRHARLTPPKVGPRTRRHVTAAAGNTTTPPSRLVRRPRSSVVGGNRSFSTF